MKRKILSTVLAAVMVLCTLTLMVSAEKNTEDIVILYENDVHCSIDGYSKLSAMKKELKEAYSHVGVVSSGDYIQGSVYGALSEGEYIIKLMNLVGYDAVTVGNHEFDYLLPRLDELVDMMNTKPVCCNLQRLGEAEPYFAPYTIVSYGGVNIAYLGITTPSTITSTSPAQFKDDDGNYIFTFHPDDLYSVVQSNVDAAVSQGADYVIALSHVGDEEPIYDVEELIKNTSGLDVVLDAHSHSVIEGRALTNKKGERVILSSTGTKLEYIGRLEISDKGISTRLVKTEDYKKTDPTVDAYLKQIESECALLGEKKVATSKVALTTHDADGNRLVRIAETNLGDFCSDALRSVMGADIGYVNGGGIRAEIPAGEVTYNDLMNVFPFNNTVVLAKITGSDFRDMLEMALLEWPEECSFPHLSGVTFSVNTKLPSSVILNENEEFCGLSGEYRVYDVKILNRQTNEYEPLELTKKYTIASTNYYLVDHGSGMTMLNNVEILKNDGMSDVDALEQYASRTLGGVIGQEYAEVSPNITFTEGALKDETQESKTLIIIFEILSFAFILFLLSFALLRLKKEFAKQK